MIHRAGTFAALLAVIGLSVLFGVILSGRLNGPAPALAAAEPVVQPAPEPVRLAPVVSGPSLPGFADIVERSLPSVVGVTNTQAHEQDPSRGNRFHDEFFHWFFGQPDERERSPFERFERGFGSGFVVSSDGYILTNHHVVAEADRIVVGLLGGQKLPAEVVGRDPAIDLAVLKVDPRGVPLQALPLGDSDKLRVGEWVIAIGNPLEFQQTVTVGVVSAKERRVQIGDTDSAVVHFIQTDAAINFGNSGGPLLDASGNVVGISTAIRRGNQAEGIGFALPINEVRAALDQLLSGGQVRRGYLGISLNTTGLDEVSAEYYGLPDTRGAIVKRVEADRPADQAGLRKDDVIRKVNGQVVKDNLDLIRKISSRKPGDAVQLEVFREGKTLVKTVRLVERELTTQARGDQRPPEDPAEPEEHVAASGLGVTVENLVPSVRERLELDDDVKGVLVTGVDFDSAAADAGIAPRAIILSVNDREVPKVSDWNQVVERLRPGAPVKIEVLDPRLDESRYVFIRVPEEK
jgi:serine protease Do